MSPYEGFTHGRKMYTEGWFTETGDLDRHNATIEDESASEEDAAGPSTAGPTTAGSSAAGPSTAGPSIAGPSTAGPSTAGPSTAGPSTAGPSVAGPSVTGSWGATSAVPQPDYTFGRSELNGSIPPASDPPRVERPVDQSMFSARVTEPMELSAEPFLNFSAASGSESRTNTSERRDDTEFNGSDAEHDSNQGSVHDSDQGSVHDSNQESVHSEDSETGIHPVLAHMRHHSAIARQKQAKKFNKNTKTHEFKVGDIARVIIPDRYRVARGDRPVFFGRVTHITKTTRQHTIQTELGVLSRRPLTKELGALPSALNKSLKDKFPDKPKTVTMKQLAEYQSKSKQKQISCKCKSFPCSSRCTCQKHGKRCSIYCHGAGQECGNVAEGSEFQQYALVDRAAEVVRALEK